MRILHVVATDQRRGAETFASDLVRATDGRVSQCVAILRHAARDALVYEAPTTFLGSAHRRLPGLRLDLAKVRTFRRLIASWGPDVIQVHGGEALKYAVLGERMRPIVYRRIGSAPPRVKTGLTRRAHSAMIQRATRVVAVSEATRRETINVFGILPRSVLTIAGGVDPERLRSQRDIEAIRRALGIAPRSRMILSLGALSPEKDPLAHVRVTARVLHEIPEAVHVLAGDGPLRPEVTAAVRALSLEGRVLVLGVRSDVGDLLAAADITLLASRTEGMPSCLIEAGMAGVPGVAYAVGGVPEVIQDGVTGVLVPRGDEDGLSSSIIRLLRDDPVRTDMGRTAAQRYGEAFGIATVAPRYLEVYRDVLDGALETSGRRS